MSRPTGTGATTKTTNTGTSSSTGTGSATGTTNTSETSSTEITETDTTEKSMSEHAGDQTVRHQSQAGSWYDTSVSDAIASSRDSPSTTLEQYSSAGPRGKSEASSFLSKIKQLIKPAAKKPDGGKVGRRIYVLRHGERMDRIFPEWLQVAITEDGSYKPYDINQPLTILERVSGHGWSAYEHDSPLTEIGHLGSQILGRGFKNCKIEIKHVFSSPALRCVQTAHNLLKVAELDVKINVEPGLFEWLQWYDKMPQWFEPKFLAQSAKYKISESYKPVMSVADVAAKKKESVKDYFQRISDVTKKILENSKYATGTVVIIGHGSTLHGIGRSLTGKPVQELSRSEMEQMGVQYPYCSLVSLEEQSANVWKVQPSSMPQMNFLFLNNRFNVDYFNKV